MKQHEPLERERIKNFLMYLFPTLELVWTMSNFPDGIESVWRSELRVCCEDIFPMYFRMALPEGAISNAEMQTLLKLSHDEHLLGVRLLQLANELGPDGMTRVRPVLDRLQNYTRTAVSAEQARSIISALIIKGDKLLVPGDEPTTILGLGTEVSINRVIYQFLPILGEDERFHIIGSAIEGSESIDTVVREVALLERYPGETQPRHDDLISEHHLNQLRDQALLKIKNTTAEASGGRLTRRRDRDVFGSTVSNPFPVIRTMLSSRRPSKFALGTKGQRDNVVVLSLFILDHFESHRDIGKSPPVGTRGFQAVRIARTRAWSSEI